MIRTPPTLPPAVARRFVDDMRAFHAEPNAIKADEIAGRQLQTCSGLTTLGISPEIRETGL
jgi:hypothetical protein